MQDHVQSGAYKDVVLFLATAGVVVPLFRRWRLSPILGFLGAPRSALPAEQAAGPPATLTARQLQVAALVASGLTNRQIAGRLGIEERSAEGHVERIRKRLGVRSRAQIATWWASAHGD